MTDRGVVELKDGRFAVVQMGQPIHVFSKFADAEIRALACRSLAGFLGVSISGESIGRWEGYAREELVRLGGAT